MFWQVSGHTCTNVPRVRIYFIGSETHLCPLQKHEAGEGTIRLSILSHSFKYIIFVLPWFLSLIVNVVFLF